MEAKLSLFKVACLKYEPNPVKYQHKLLDRKELLSLQKVIAEMAVQQLESMKVKVESVHNLPGVNTQFQRPDSPERTALTGSE